MERCPSPLDYYSARNRIVDFLVSRSKTFATEAVDHDPRRVPLVRIGRTEPTVISAPKVVDAASTQAVAR